jgi:hypothetical protein
MFYVVCRDDTLAVGNYDRAIKLSSAAINLSLAADTIFANCSKVRSGKMLWEDALLNAEKVQCQLLFHIRCSFW